MNGRRVAAAAATLTACAAVAVPGGSAAPATHRYALAVGGMAVVPGSDVICIADHEKQLDVACGRFRGSGFAAGSYATVLAADGSVGMVRVGAGQKLTKVFERKAQSAQVQRILVRPGDGFTVPGTKLGCIGVAGGVSCFRYDAGGVVAGSYGTIVTAKYAAVERYGADRKAASTVVERLHG